MARSVHTDPIDIRAARRLATARAARGLGDPRRVYRLARHAKHNGGTLRHTPQPTTGQSASRIRIIRYAPGSNHIHPASPAEVRRFLAQLPPRYRYKLHTIELRPAPPRSALPLGGMLLPGGVILYAQPRSPWLLGGIPADAEQSRLRRSGAQVSVDYRSCLTVVTWPAQSLREFMLQDVLLHELAHHLLQVRRARSLVPVARAADHEAVANGLNRRFSRRPAAQAVEYA